jgi:hypothetical protein
MRLVNAEDILENFLVGLRRRCRLDRFAFISTAGDLDDILAEFGDFCVSDQVRDDEIPLLHEEAHLFFRQGLGDCDWLRLSLSSNDSAHYVSPG